jgi:predicted metal-dependent enzyme (double-stranded beta helix superfamily)
MRDWHINATGNIEAGQDADNFELPDGDYRLYRFLTELEDLQAEITNETEFLQQLCPMVRRLLTRSFWLQGSYKEPNPDTGWSVEMLYDEPDFPLTVQMVAWQPGTLSPIHNHGAWGLVAFVDGLEKNIFWQEQADGQLAKVGEHIFEAGDIVTFVPESIHHIEAMGEDTVISFNIYGKTDYKKRFKFDPQTHQKTLF